MIVGFVDDLGNEVRFEDIHAGKGMFRYPRPVVRALARQYRDTGAHYNFDPSKPGVSATELANPIQQTYLLKRHEVFVQPDDSYYAMLGTIMHAVLDQGTEGSDTEMRERKIVAEIDGYQVGGTIDLVTDLEPGLMGHDYKLTSSYKVNKMLTEGVRYAAPDYFWQANIYAWLLLQEYGTAPDRWELCLLCRDHGSRSRHRKIETVEVELVDPELVERHIKRRIEELQAAADLPDIMLPGCSKSETWFGRRCANYCAAQPFCHQTQGRQAA